MYRSVFFLGLLSGGPAAVWYFWNQFQSGFIVNWNIRSSYIITIVFMTMTAAVLAEICSALPLSGSIYIWAAESAGPKYARFFGFIVAWWSCTAWMTFTAGNCQVGLQHLWFCKRRYTLRRRLQTTSFLYWLYGKLTFRGGSLTIISNGGVSSGPYLKYCLSSRLRSIICPQGCTLLSSNSLSRLFLRTFYSVWFGCLSGLRKHMASALLKRCSLRHVSFGLSNLPYKIAAFR